MAKDLTYFSDGATLTAFEIAVPASGEVNVTISGYDPNLDVAGKYHVQCRVRGQIAGGAVSIGVDTPGGDTADRTDVAVGSFHFVLLGQLIQGTDPGGFALNLRPLEGAVATVTIEEFSFAAMQVHD